MPSALAASIGELQNQHSTSPSAAMFLESGDTSTRGATCSPDQDVFLLTFAVSAETNQFAT